MAERRTLIIIRGNSGAGKSSVARAVRDRYGRGCALIEQDYLRRTILREHDTPAMAGLTPGFISNAARFALDNGYHVLVEGILARKRYGAALRDLIDGHSGASHVYYLDVSFAESVRRHATRPQAAEFDPDQMRDWYVPRDILGVADEHIIPESSRFDETVDLILRTSGLLAAPPLVLHDA